MSSNHLILCRPLLLLPSIFPSIRVFSNESALQIRWPKYWSFSFNISPSNEHPGLITFRMDQLDLLAVQGTLKSLLQHHSSKALILQRSAFFIVQLSHPYMTTGKTIALTRWTFVGKVIAHNIQHSVSSWYTASWFDTSICFKMIIRLSLWPPDAKSWLTWPGLGRSPGGGHGNPLQYSCLENLHELRSLVGYNTKGHKELHMTEWLSTQHYIRHRMHSQFYWISAAVVVLIFPKREDEVLLFILSPVQRTYLKSLLNLIGN